MTEWLRKIGAWFSRPVDEMAEELETHRALIEDELRRSGLSDAEAAAESRRRMGNPALASEDAREVWMIQWLDRLQQHVRYGLRGLRREPGFALTAFLTLGVGMAATTTVFSVVNSELWAPVPYPEPYQLLALGSRDPKTNTSDGITLGELRGWREHITALQSLAAYGRMTRRTAQLGSAESFRTTEVTASYFTTLGRRAILGRVFAVDDVPGIVPVVLTDYAWARVFNRDPGVIGRTFPLDDDQVTIVGVVERDDSMGGDGDLYIPIDERSVASTSGPFYTMIGRLAPNATPAVVVDQLQAAINDWARTDSRRLDHRAIAMSLSDYYRTTNARPLYFFLGASVVVLLLTVANVASLIVARAVRRTPEFAVRTAIGGGTRTLAAQMVVEAALIAIPGFAISLVLTNAALSALGQFVPGEYLYRGARVAIESRVLGFSIVLSMMTTAALALLPLGIVRRVADRAALTVSRRSTDSRGVTRMRAALLTAQLALTVTLLAGAGVFVKSFLALTQVPLGFVPTNAWSLRMTLAGSRFADDDAVRTYTAGVVERLKGAPGVEHAAVATSSPLISGRVAMVTPSPAPAGVPPLRTIVRTVGVGYFQAIGTTVIRGRAIASDDRRGGPIVAVVNEEFVRQTFGDKDPIGQSVEFSGMRAPFLGQGIATIVGIAADIKEVGLNEVSMPDLYLPFDQRPDTSIELIVRGRGADPAMSNTLRAAVADPLVPVTFVENLQNRVRRALAQERFNLIVVSLFAVMAVLTAAIGVYGAISYAVTARWREFGVRLAMGASPASLVTGTLWQSARLAVTAGLIGLCGALALARWIGDGLYLVRGSHNGLLYNTSTTDPLALAASLAGVMALSMIASVLPARRASRVDPATALRAD